MKKKLSLLFLLLAIVTKAQIINIPDANFKAKLLSSSPANTVAKNLSGNYFAIDANGDGEIQQTEAEQVKYLDIFSSNIYSLIGIISFINLQYLSCSSNLLSSLDVHGLINLQFLDCTGNQLTLLNVQGLTNLLYLYCPYNQLTSLNAQGLTNLQFLDCEGNQLTSLNVQSTNLVELLCNDNQLTSLNIQGLTNLQLLGCHSNQLTSLNLQGITNLQVLFGMGNQLTSLNVQGCINLLKLYCNGNQLTSLNVQGLTNLVELYCDENQINSLNTQGCIALKYLGCHNNQLTSLNVEGCIALQNLWCMNNQLSSLFLKNGSGEIVDFNNNPSLQYVCADDSQIPAIQSSLASQGLTNVNINTYCSFVPGGSYNTITGLVRFDENNNGCDTNDEIFEHMKLKISDGTTGETFVKNNGKYDFYTQAGNFTVTAEPENPALFTVTPATFSTSFPNNNNNIFTQDLCVTKNGNANDLEVVIAPLTNAVPGFDAKYKVMWRNKGNTILSGNVTFTFNASKMDFVSSALPSAVSGNQITFNFTNLKPYANTASEVTFNIHPPTHPTNPANAGDQLNFVASLGVVPGDINPADNTFNYQQTVINSFDPNDIVCLQGNTIPAVMIGNYLHYVVNFENLGTAPATNIVVEMDINPADFDISSLQLQNASHQVYTKVTGNKAEFMMKSANLGSGGHGNILLKMKSKGTLNPGDQLMNKANIYFDYNFPIKTNDAITNIAGVLKVEENLNTTSTEVYPNPTKGEVNINAESEIKAVEVYDNAGRIIQKQIGINARKTTLTIRNENTGVFYLKIVTDKGSMVKKVIKN
ncbi:DUF7619 domain-containing protein [Chryseobacterium takakiae]|uniref:Conserved repeat domain-containing protein/Por secretion system C-terminal sorting domain-containing protein n=1 Tax=Chryseobacterium takakiae TaxID=1302685 RepID=A0A1M4W6P5_9FLAO|nr:T9SS type A sorting domain-containing protein [Chryseobacterium takakiae]SHE76877.1 conserved repeat domain-containing protein/Por secretion system C-terminal sorting domain-containing protein [Chryseobacterium takakiae]